MSTRRISWG